MPLKETGFIGAILALGVGMALSDMRLLSVMPVSAFPLHNLLATGIGVALIAISLRLLGRTTEHRHVLLLNILVGIGMIIIHTLKLITGKCT